MSVLIYHGLSSGAIELLQMIFLPDFMSNRAPAKHFSFNFNLFSNDNFCFSFYYVQMYMYYSSDLFSRCRNTCIDIINIHCVKHTDIYLNEVNNSVIYY